MNPKSKRKKVIWQSFAAPAFGILIGAAFGSFIAFFAGDSLAEKLASHKLLSLLELCFALYAAILLQIVLHEAGHLVCGLLSGYRFSSFRIFSFLWLKEGNRIRFKRLSLAGTGGQCLMIPPDLVDGKIPLVFYNLGGPLMNLFSGVVFFIGFLFCPDLPFLPAFLFLLSVIGILFALTNGIPMRMGMVDNDGRNAFALAKNPAAVRAFWIQLSVNAQTANGVRLKDMPEEWFAVPSDDAMKNSMTAVMGVFACNRLMDAQRFDEAEQLMAHMLELDSGMVDLHRNLMICDRLSVELLGENRRELLEEMLTTGQKNFMKSMKNFPSVLRTEYLLALRYENNAEKAKKIKERFEKCARAYPYPGEVQAERELMELAQKKEETSFFPQSY